MKKMIFGFLSLLMLLIGCQQKKEDRMELNFGKIDGTFYQAAGSGRKPAVIISHGFGGSKDDLTAYGKAMQQAGYHAYLFNFINGGANGTTKNMSVLSEARDLRKVYNEIIKRDDVDTNNIILMGESQGGFVSAYVGSQINTKIRTMVLLYPAFVIQDDIRERLNSSDPHSIMGMEVSDIYNSDGISFDIYEEIKKYTGQVLIIHGTADTIVPISYSKRAAKAYPHAKLVTIKNAGHGFYGEDRRKAIKEVTAFLSEKREK